MEWHSTHGPTHYTLFALEHDDACYTAANVYECVTAATHLEEVVGVLLHKAQVDALAIIPDDALGTSLPSRRVWPILYELHQPAHAPTLGDAHSQATLIWLLPTAVDFQQLLLATQVSHIAC